jgi:hypothetical protein
VAAVRLKCADPAQTSHYFEHELEARVTAERVWDHCYFHAESLAPLARLYESLLRFHNSYSHDGQEELHLDARSFSGD